MNNFPTHFELAKSGCRARKMPPSYCLTFGNNRVSHFSTWTVDYRLWSPVSRLEVIAKAGKNSSYPSVPALFLNLTSNRPNSTKGYWRVIVHLVVQFCPAFSKVVLDTRNWKSSSFSQLPLSEKIWASFMTFSCKHFKSVNLTSLFNIINIQFGIKNLFSRQSGTVWQQTVKTDR